MTKQEYQDYQDSVASFFDRERIENLSSGVVCCPNCGDNFPDNDYAICSCGQDYQALCEPSFSWERCECCGSTLGGDRYPMTGYHKESGNIFDYSVCIDCLYYTAYGQLDDMQIGLWKIYYYSRYGKKQDIGYIIADYSKVPTIKKTAKGITIDKQPTTISFDVKLIKGDLSWKQITLE